MLGLSVPHWVCTWLTALYCTEKCTELALITKSKWLLTGRAGSPGKWPKGKRLRKQA